MKNTDEELFLKWQQGSAEALEALVRDYHAPLLAHLFRLVGNVHSAEDLVQDTFIHLLRDKHLYQYPRPFKPWIFTIAVPSLQCKENSTIDARKHALLRNRRRVVHCLNAAYSLMGWISEKPCYCLKASNMV
jgi:DNA-directed RNA polymerase specialized sigma24 family protein